MLVSCSICKDLFFPNSEVCGTQCGHLYHETCIKKWQECSGSCPQCRTKLKEKPHRIYFVIEDSPDADGELDVTTLKHKIDSIREDLVDAKRKNEQLEETNASVRKEIAAYAEKAASSEATIRALKQKIKEFNRENEELRPLLQANEALKLKLRNLDNLQIVLQGTENEVREMINKTPVTPLAVHQLCVYVEALKSQLKLTEEKFRKENETLLLNYKAAKQKLRDLLGDGNSKKIQTSPKKSRKINQNAGFEIRNPLKRPNTDNLDSTEFENSPSCSSSNFECHPPVPRKQTRIAPKKVINNLEKTSKRDIPSDSSDVDVPIYPGPSRSKVLKSAIAWESKSIFRNITAIEKSPNDMKARIDVAYDVWGRSRSVCTVSSRPDKIKFGSFPRRK